MIACVESALFDEEAGDAFGLLVELRAVQRLSHGALAIEKREQDVVRRRMRTPAKDLGNELVFFAGFRLLFQSANVPSVSGG